MKKFNKVLAGLVAVATLGCVSLIPMDANAIVIKDNEEYYGDMSYYEENALTDAIITVEDENGNVIGKYYWSNTKTHTIPDAIVDEYGNSYDATEIDFPVEIDDTFDTSNVKQNVTVEANHQVLVDMVDYYTYMVYEINDIQEYTGWYILESTIPKEDTTIGDSESTSITEFTVGESTYPRGDINLDGNVNTVDLLMLKKYLLGLMEW